jgi:invasion protein IalB
MRHFCIIRSSDLAIAVGNVVIGRILAVRHVHRKLFRTLCRRARSTAHHTRFAATILGTAATLAASVPVAMAQVETVGTFGDWQLQCDTPPGAQQEQCALIQTVQAADRENIGLVVIVLKTADQQAQLIRIVAPLGVLLQFQLGLNVDGEPIGRIEFVRCVVEGCVAEALLEPELLEQLRNGNSATFIVFVTPEEGIGIPVSLVGFGQGFDALP